MKKTKIIFSLLFSLFLNQAHSQKEVVVFDKGMDIKVEKPEKPSGTRGSSERENERSPSGSTNSNKSKPESKVSPTSAQAITQINNIITSVTVIKKLLYGNEILKYFSNPYEALVSMAFTIKDDDWKNLGDAYKNLDNMQNPAIRNVIEATRFELDQKIMEHNGRGEDASDLKKELKFWEKMDKALPATSFSNPRVGSIRDFQLFVSYNVTENNQVGIKFYPKFTIDNAQFSEGIIGVYFYSGNQPLKDYNNIYRSGDGNVASYNYFEPTYTNSVYNSNSFDFGVFIPYSELHLPSGTFTINYLINIFDYDASIYQTGYYSFSVTIP